MRDPTPFELFTQIKHCKKKDAWVSENAAQNTEESKRKEDMSSQASVDAILLHLGSLLHLKTRYTSMWLVKSIRKGACLTLGSKPLIMLKVVLLMLIKLLPYLSFRACVKQFLNCAWS